MVSSGPEVKVPIYQIKVTLEHSKPPIWRRLLVSSDSTLGELHDIIQAAMGWWDYHLHQFIVGDWYYGVPDPDYLDYMEMNDELDVTLGQIAPREGFKFRYEYDFGDSWVHQVLVEKILPPDAGGTYPLCIKGRRACPPEDVGGIWGYYDFLEAIDNPDHDQHDEYLEWVGGEFDPEAFDLEEVNQALHNVLAMRAEAVEGELALPDGWGFEAEMIPRNAVIVKPKQPLIDWVNRTIPGDEPLTLEDLKHDCSTYLIPDVGSIETALLLLSPLKTLFFEMELEEWTDDEDTWPVERTAATFDLWFDLEVHSMVYDLSLAMPDTDFD